MPSICPFLTSLFKFAAMRAPRSASHGFIAQKHMLVTRIKTGQELLHEGKNIGRRGVSFARQSRAGARTKTKPPRGFPRGGWEEAAGARRPA
jgi:hypothetical protein